MNQFLLKSEIKNENDIVWARKKTRDFAQYLKLDKQEQTRLATAVSEITRNAFQYAGRGMIEFGLTMLDERVFIEIIVKDNGPGIRDLKAVLQGTYVSREGMGVGLIGSKKLVDNLTIESGPQGTTIVLHKIVPLRRALLTPLEINSLLDTFVSQAASDPIEEIQKQNQEILLTLAALNEKKDELSRLNQELEDTNRGVVALYAELDEKAESLRIANESKTSFLSDMTHEFRSPLNSIMSISDILLEDAEGEDNKERAKQVNFIKKAAKSLSDLVNDLLDISKIEAGKIPVRVDTYNVEDVFSTLRGLMRPLAAANPNVTLIFEEVPPHIEMSSDEGKIAQIMRNLISNAIKYTEKGEIVVSAKIINNDEIEFKVKDTGIGIAKENLETIFSEFYQIDNSLQKRYKGTGLGLSLTKKLTTLLRGEIFAKSTLGVGSEFKIILPLNYTGPMDAVYKTKESPLLPKKKVKKILVIDDDESHRNLFKKLLDRKSIEILEAPNGTIGFKLAQINAPDLIILDLVMPDVDGFDFLRLSIADSRTKNIPIILNTSKDLSEEEQAYLEQMTILVTSKSEGNLKRIEDLIDKMISQPEAKHD